MTTTNTPPYPDFMIVSIGNKFITSHDKINYKLKISSMNLKIRIGISFLILGIAMFLFGIHVFTYMGEFTQLFSDTGLICILGCFPTLVIGIIVLVFGTNEKNNKDKNLNKS